MKNKKSDAQSMHTPFAPRPRANRVQMPQPRSFNGKLYYGMADVAKILGVTRQTVSNWNSTLYFDCPLFTADERAHDGTFLYEVERVMQLKSVYHADWMRGGYEPAPFIPSLENLPLELLNQKRFFPVVITADGRKVPTIKDWGNPDNQKHCSEVQGLLGFDICGHSLATDYALLDFDHVLNDGKFINDTAETCFNDVQNKLQGYCERSVSGDGLHIIIAPTTDKFPMISNGKNGVLHFGDGAKLEIFFKPKARYCLLTADLFNCEPNAPVAHGQAADDVLQALLDKIAAQASKASTEPKKPSNPAQINLNFDERDYDIYRARIMLNFIPVADLQGSEWLAAISALKNLGYSYDEVDRLNRGGQHYNEPANRKRWLSLNDSSFDIETLHGIAKNFGYDEKDARRQWFQQQPEQNPALDFSAFEELNRWQEINGKINPDTLKRLQKEKARIDALNVFSSSIAYDTSNLKLLGSFLYYSFFSDTVDSFFLKLENAKQDAKAKIAEQKKQPDAPALDTQLLALAKIDIHKIRSRVDAFFKDARRDHKAFLAQFALDQQNAKLQAQRNSYINDTPSTKKIISDCPVDFLLPEGVYFSADGIRMVDWDKPVTRNGRPIIQVAKSPIVPVKIFREPDKNFTQYEIAIRNKQGIWRTAVFDGRTLLDPKKISELAEYGALIENAVHLAKFFARFIHKNIDIIPEIKAYKQPGWHNDHFIYPVVNPDYVIRRAGFNYEEDFRPHGDPDLWLKTFITAYQQGGAIAATFLGTSLAAPLVKPLNLPNLQTHLHGEPNCGKSGLEKLAASIFGNPKELIRTFGATLKNRQAVAAAFNDLPTFLDELGTVQGGKKGEDSLAQMIYEFFEGKANQANKRDGSVRDSFKYRGSRVSSAEHPMLKDHDAQGSFKRLLQLHCKDKLFDEAFAASLHPITENNFGLFGLLWTNFVQDNINLIRDKYLEFFEHYGNIQPKRKIEPTLFRTVVTANLATQFFLVATKFNSDFDAFKLCDDIKAVTDTLPSVDEMDEALRALDALRSFVAGHPRNFYMPHSENSVSFYPTPNEYFGKKFSNNEVAFFPTSLKKIIEHELGFASLDALLCKWAQRGFLRCSNGSGYRISIRINGILTKVYRFNAGVLLSDEDEDTEFCSET